MTDSNAKKFSYLTFKEKLGSMSNYVISHFIKTFLSDEELINFKQIINEPKSDKELDVAIAYFEACDTLLENDSLIDDPSTVKVADREGYKLLSKSMSAIIELENQKLRNNDFDPNDFKLSNESKKALNILENNISENNINKLYKICSEILLFNAYFKDYISIKYVCEKDGIYIDERNGFNIKNIALQNGNISAELRDSYNALLLIINFIFKDSISKEKLKLDLDTYKEFFNTFTNTISEICNNRIYD